MATKENLKEAFAGESQANRKYLAFAKKAETEGLKGIAKYFRAAAAAETVHALAHFRVMGGIGSTEQNLKEAVKGEEFEFKNMYPQFISQANEENQKAALASFQNALAVEQIHYSLYISAMESLQGGKDVEECRMFVCSVCGNTVMDQAPEKCPICGVPKEKFDEVK